MPDDHTRAPVQSVFFQLAYVTRDINAATAQFKQRFMPCEFMIVPNNNPAPGADAVKRIAYTWTGATMTEILEVDTALPSIFRDAVPAAPGEVALHHLGYLVDDYAETLRRLRAWGYAMPILYDSPGFAQACYADTRAAGGIYHEYIHIGSEGRTWYTGIPGFQRFPG
jgi:hypothetical protein